MSRVQSEIVELPAEWVAFDADYVSTDVQGTVKLSGRYFRNSDGSWRQDGRTADGTFTSRISNIAKKQSYTFLAQRSTWMGRPLDMEVTGFAPPRNIRKAMQGLSKLDQPFESFEVYENRNPSGRLLCTFRF